MKSYAKKRSATRAGFTLVELLVVIIIISILAALTMSIQQISVRAARESRTRTTISKIDAILTSLYEKYQYRKVDVEQFSDADLENWTLIPVTSDPSLRREARLCMRTLMLRELARMEMPTCFAEMDFPSNYYQQSALNNSYKLVGGGGITNSELLYLIVTNGDPESRAAFHSREIADTNGNGLMEFVDGWDQPIRFLRWAPALANSSRQPVLSEAWLGYKYLYDAAPNYTPELYGQFVTRYPVDILERYPDPLNPLELSTDRYSPSITGAGVGTEQENAVWPDGWLLVPLVFSFGPDGDPGLEEPVVCFNNPFDPDAVSLGATKFADDGSDPTLDNITNHNFYQQ